MAKRIAWEPTEEKVGCLLPYILDDNVTDIDINADMDDEEITAWITDINKGEYKLENHNITKKVIEQLTYDIEVVSNGNLNPQKVSLEADTNSLRISFLHESNTKCGRVICIRKSPPFLRHNMKSIVESGYCSKEVLSLLINCVYSRMNFIFTGDPGAGKTECLKFFSQFIKERVATIEDTPEIHFKEINPYKNGIELFVTPGIFDYDTAIEKCLRYHVAWILLSESRGKEASQLITQWSTGCRGMTTIHTDDVRNIPDRMMEMMGKTADYLENKIYTYANVGILVKIRITDEGAYERYIDQVCFFTRENGVNECHMIVEDGMLISTELPESVKKKFADADISNPFECKTVDDELAKEDGDGE